jgi:hypothetical protein
MQTQAEEAEVSDGQDGIRDVERDADNDHAERVGEQVPVDDPPLGGSDDPRSRIRAEADRNRCQAAAFSQVKWPTHRDGPVIYKTAALPVR